MKRTIEKHLLEWKDKSLDKALLVTGARQTGKDYKVHSALNHLLKTYDKIETAYILSNNNLSVDNRKVYLPVYMTGCIGRSGTF